MYFLKLIELCILFVINVHIIIPYSQKAFHFSITFPNVDIELCFVCKRRRLGRVGPREIIYYEVLFFDINIILYFKIIYLLFITKIFVNKY